MLLDGIDKARDQFWLDSLGNPEVEQEAIAPMLGCFDQYKRALEQLLQMLPDVSAVSVAAGLIENYSSTLREYHETVDRGWVQGPTPIRYVNQLVRHASYLRNGGQQVRHTLARLGKFAPFREATLAVFTRAETQHVPAESRLHIQHALNSIEAQVRGMSEWIRSRMKDDAVPPGEREPFIAVEGELVAAGKALGDGLATLARHELSEDPTPLYSVNLVCMLLGTPRSRNTIERCVASLEAERGKMTPDAAVALDEVLAILHQLAELPAGENLVLSLQRGRLIDATLRLCNAWSGMQDTRHDEDEQLDFVYSDASVAQSVAPMPGLPRQLREVLEQAQGVLRGNVDPQQFADTLAAVEGSLQQMRTAAMRAGVLDRPNLVAALAAFDEGLEALSAVLEMKSATGLATAQHSLHRAAELLWAERTS
jgi:hypothetical protein